LHHNGRDLRELPLFERKIRLEKLIVAANVNWLRYSESFDDGVELLQAAERLVETERCQRPPVSTRKIIADDDLCI
jgi:ATP-dependent DNA ligase